MKYRCTALIIFSIFLFHHTFSYGQSVDSEIENTQISILTCRSGDELYSTFGHTAIRVFNPDQKSDYVFNYGLFSFDTPNFYPKFMSGRLPYFVGATSMENFLREYKYEKRSVFEQVLNLDNAQKREIIDFLIENVKPENRAYKYDFFFDNCATRIVDVFQLSGDVTYSFNVEPKTFRNLLKENLQNLVWSDFGIDLVIGARADRLTNRRDQMFLPEYVMANLETAKVNGTNDLAQSPYLVLDFEELNEVRKQKSINWPLVCTSILLLITLIVNVFVLRKSNVYNKAILIISGTFGLFLLIMWFGTNHVATKENWNIMWLNPFLFLLLSEKGKIKQILTYVMGVLLILSALNCMVTFLPQFFNFAFLPIILSILAVIYFESNFRGNTNKSIIESQA